MSSFTEDLIRRYATARGGDGGPLPPDAVQAWEGVTTTLGRLGAARVRDSARRRWLLEAHRDRERGRYLVVRPVQGDNEPFRASADGYRPEAYLPITPDEWTLLALLVWGRDGGDEGREDERLRNEGFRVVDRLVVAAQHEGLMGAAEDEDD